MLCFIRLFHLIKNVNVYQDTQYKFPFSILFSPEATHAIRFSFNFRAMFSMYKRTDCFLLSCATGNMLCLLFCILLFFSFNSMKQEIVSYIHKKSLTILYSYTVFYRIDFHNLFNYWPSDGHLDYFQSFVMTDDAAISNPLDNLFHRCVDYTCQINSLRWKC